MPYIFIVGVAILVVLCGLLAVLAVSDRRRRTQQMTPIVDSMLSSHGQDMRQRFQESGEEEVIEFTYLVLSEAGANEELMRAWKKLEQTNDPSNPYHRLWTLQLQLASTPAFLLSKGNRHFVWAIVQIGREKISVNVKHVQLSLLEQQLRRSVTETVEDIKRLVKARKREVTIEAVKDQPDLSSLTILRIPKK